MSQQILLFGVTMKAQIQSIQNYYDQWCHDPQIDQYHIKSLLVSYLNKEIQSQKIKAVNPLWINHQKTFIISNIYSPRNQLFFIFAKLKRISQITPNLFSPFKEKYIHFTTAATKYSVKIEARAFKKNCPEEFNQDKLNKIKELEIDIFLKKNKIQKLENKIKFNNLFSHPF